MQAAGDASRIRHIGSQQPTGEPAQDSGTVNVESGVPDHAIRGLLDKGHEIARVKGDGFGGYQAIRIDWERGTLHGATESRKDGVTLGY